MSRVPRVLHKSNITCCAPIISCMFLPVRPSSAAFLEPLLAPGNLVALARSPAPPLPLCNLTGEHPHLPSCFAASQSGFITQVPICSSVLLPAAALCAAHRHRAGGCVQGASPTRVVHACCFEPAPRPRWPDGLRVCPQTPGERSQKTPGAGSMRGQRRRRWPSIEPASTTCKNIDIVWTESSVVFVTLSPEHGHLAKATETPLTSLVAGRATFHILQRGI